MAKLTLTSAALLALFSTTSAFSSSNNGFEPGYDEEFLASLSVAFPHASMDWLRNTYMPQASSLESDTHIPSHTVAPGVTPSVDPASSLASFDPEMLNALRAAYPYAPDTWLAEQVVHMAGPALASAASVDLSHMPMASVVLTQEALQAGLEVPMAAMSILPTREQADAIRMEDTMDTQGFKDWATTAGIDLNELTHASYFPLVEMYREHLATNNQTLSDEDGEPYYGSDADELPVA